jgi:SAM-dependent methyltransferase
MFPPPNLRRSWTQEDLVGLFPEPIRALDVGAGRNPLGVRPQDELVTVDFEVDAGPEVAANVATSWPFGEEEFDLIYMSHVVEHFYPADRDAVIRNVYSSLRPGGLVFIRVPHRSSFQAPGWEHYSAYGLPGVVSLCHGHNPLLPMFRSVSVGVSLDLDFKSRRSPLRLAAERALSRYWKLTDMLLAPLLGGIAEVQFMLQRMDEETERRLREGPAFP